jgi:hypothetical protein
MKSFLMLVLMNLSFSIVLPQLVKNNYEDIFRKKSSNITSDQTIYSWETPQATFLPGGDLAWAPKPFVLVKGASVRYIDFDNGNDNYDGLTTSTAWKHHPWDNAATGTAKNSTGIHTYIFKRGVVYRGSLNARESGTTDNPVLLTSDPDWGSGEACIYGSLKVTGGWTRSSAAISPKIPNPEQVWYKSITGLENLPKTVCELTGSEIKQIRLARIPNYQNTGSEPMKKWWSFTGKEKKNNVLYLQDTRYFTQSDVNFYKGGDVWAIEDVIVMCTLWKQKIDNYEPANKKIVVADQNFGGVDCKYFIENTPYLLDTVSEYYYDNIVGRMFLRLDQDKDPNTTTIEIASRSNLLTISSKTNIEISGLTFGFTTYDNVRYGTDDGMPAIKIENSSNIKVSNCRFLYVNGGIMANGSGSNLTICDNEMLNMNDFSILLNGPDNIYIFRNRIYENGTRHLGRWYSAIPAIAGKMRVAEIAGNIIEYSWGSGINITWGKGSDQAYTVPFIRGLVYQNKVSHSLMGVNDYGGIEGWQGGPAYYFNNISEDAQGWHYNWWIGNVISIGYPFYFDGAFKQYVFNNIAVGTGWNRTQAAYTQVLGFYNMYVHNIAYNVGSLTLSGDGVLAPDGQNCYLANVSDSNEMQFNHTTRESGIPFESFGYNFFSGHDFLGTFVTNDPNPRFEFTFNDFVDKLNSYVPDLGQVGFEASKRVFANPSASDFRPTASSELIDQGMKFFAPFPLSSVVGEWHFYKHMSDSSLIKGENFYFTSEFTNRETYKNVPKNHMKAYGLSAGSFVKGNLEDWTEGALVFDGIQTYCSLNNDVTSKFICNNVDMTTNSFILESYFKTDPGHTGGVLISKFGTSGYGYQLDQDATGYPRFSILNNGSIEFSQSGSVTINDGNWHHVLAEVNRPLSSVSIYIDGILTNGSVTGAMPLSSISLTNTSDFFAGKNKDANFFSGTIDFMRISKGTLADAKTTIDELYKWEFNGPFLRDFAGNESVGNRDAGALEKGAKLCNMTVAPAVLNFGPDGGSQTFTIQAEAGFEIIGKTGSFFTYTVNDTTVTVIVQSITSGLPRSGEIIILGCNETLKAKIIQQYPEKINNLMEGKIKVMPNPVSDEQLIISIPENGQASHARFIDLTGKLVYECILTAGDNVMNIKLPQGLYLLNVLGPEINYTTKITVN